MLAPVVLFVYNRPDLTLETLTALERAELSSDSILYIFSDGPKQNVTPQQLQNIEETRRIIRSKQWCKEVIIIEQSQNLGLAQSVINGVSDVLKKHERAIILEDDIIVGRYFLHFMNEQLEAFQNDEYIAGVTGFCYLDNPEKNNFLLPIGCSWSWATWKRVWDNFITDPHTILNHLEKNKLTEQFDFGGYAFYKMLQNQALGKVDSWAIRFYGSFFINKQYFVYPPTSLVSNTGFGENATHTKASVPLFEKEAFQGRISSNKATLDGSQKQIKRTQKAFLSHRPQKQTNKKSSMIHRIKSKLKSIRPTVVDTSLDLKKITKKIDKLESDLKFQHGILLSKQQDQQAITKIADSEFKVYSQWGDDGIIQFLIKNIEIKNEYFIEFGVENYLESNTRFLLRHNNWSGLVIDGSPQHIQHIQSHPEYWQHQLTAVHSFITAENINAIFKAHHVPEDIGLLSIDVDGNDYWIWKAIDVIRPRIVIVEYNAVFGKDRAITIPYSSDFIRSKAHFSHLYFGASLPALAALGKEKGYSLIGCNTAGNNAYFLRNDCLSKFTPLDAAVAFNDSKFRESRDIHGKLDYLSEAQRYERIKNLPVVNVITGETESL